MHSLRVEADADEPSPSSAGYSRCRRWAALSLLAAALLLALIVTRHSESVDQLLPKTSRVAEPLQHSRQLLSVASGVPAGYMDPRSPAERARARNLWSPFRSEADKRARYSTWESQMATAMDRLGNPIEAFRELVGPAVNKLAVRVTPLYRARRTVVIIDGRTDEILIFILRHVFHLLGSGWGLIIFHTPKNEAWWIDTLGIYPGGSGENIELQRVTKISWQQSNALSASAALYERIPASCKSLLIVQSDSFMLRSDWLPSAVHGAAPPVVEGVKMDLSTIMDSFVYVGSPWEWCHEDWCNKAGNGGSCSRHREAMLAETQELRCTTGTEERECHRISSYEAQKSQVSSSIYRHVEDTFFSHQIQDHLHLYSSAPQGATAQIASQKQQAHFAMESMDFPALVDTPYFIHKCWNYLPRERYIPWFAHALQFYPEIWAGEEEMRLIREEQREGE